MGIGWSEIQNYGKKVLTSEEPMFHLVQTSKTAETLIITNVAANSKPVPQKTIFPNNCKFSLNEAGLGLVSGQVCAKTLPSITPMVMHALNFGGDSSSQDHKKYCE